MQILSGALGTNAITDPRKFGCTNGVCNHHQSSFNGPILETRIQRTDSIERQKKKPWANLIIIRPKYMYVVRMWPFDPLVQVCLYAYIKYMYLHMHTYMYVPYVIYPITRVEPNSYLPYTIIDS